MKQMKMSKENYYKTMYYCTHINQEETLYSQKAYYPVLEAETIVTERSRDQLGDIEQALLGFLNDGLCLLEDIGKVLGFPSPKKVFPLLEELRGQGLVKKENGQYFLTQLGEKSLTLGVAVLEVSRAFLLCGVTGRLMKKPVYRANRLGIEEFKFISRQSILIDNQMDIPLNALDITLVSNKQEYNIPDEAVEIIECESTTPKFIQASLVVTSKNNHLTHNLTINGEVIDWLDKSQILPLIEPLGWSENPNFHKSKSEILQLVKEKLLEMGFKGLSIETDTYENILVSFSMANKTGLTEEYEREPLIAYIGTQSQLPIAINMFPFRKEEKNLDYLKGHVLKLTSHDSSIMKEAELYRLQYSLEKEFYKARREKTIPYTSNFIKYMEEGLKSKDILFDDIRSVIKKYGNNFLQKKWNITS